MPGEFTSLFTRLTALQTELNSYMSTIQQTLSDDHMVHAQALNGMTALVCEYDSLISALKNMTS